MFYKPAHNCFLLNVIDDFEAKSIVLTHNRQFLEAAVMNWFYFFMARTAKPKLDEKLPNPPPKSCEQ